MTERIVRVFILGGTGAVGSPLVRELVRRGHDVQALARSEASAAKLTAYGAIPIPGDIAAPEPWIARMPHLDAIIHAACDFHSAMDEIDAHLLDILLPSLAAQPSKPRFIYTGGCWLFGATGDEVATEATPFRPLPAFAWMMPQLRRILAAPEETKDAFSKIHCDAVPECAVEAAGRRFEKRQYSGACPREVAKLVED
jgi:nucleoside-diphosphate-sugar epimerase